MNDIDTMAAAEKLIDVLVGPAYSKYYQQERHHGNHCDAGNLNQSMDVLQKTCFSNYDTLACIRGTTLVFLTAVTGILCAARVVSLHVSGHPNYYQYAIFYLAVIQCVVGCVEWVLGWSVHASLICLYLRCLELVVICHFYLTLACRVTRRSDSLASRLSAAALSLFLMYFTSFMIIGLAFSVGSWCDCFANYWLFLTGGQLVLIQMFAASAFLIIHRINAVRAQESFKKAQKLGVWILAVAFEISAIVAVTYQIVLWALATEEGGCSGVFLHKQWIYSPVRFFHDVLTTLLPFWAMLYVFKPVARVSVNAEGEGTAASSASTDRRRLIGSRNSSDDSDMMDPSLVVSPSMIRQWRRRRVSPSQSSRDAAAAVVAPRTRGSSSAGVTHGRTRRLRSFIYAKKFISSVTGGSSAAAGTSHMRRTSSAPSTLRTKRSPPLATIPEEPPANNNSQATSSTDSPPQAASVDCVTEYFERPPDDQTTGSKESESADEGAGPSASDDKKE